MKPPETRLNYDQLQTGVAAANRHFALIRKKYPSLKIYLVLSLPSGQTRIGSSPEEILKEFPALVLNDAAKALILDFLKTPEPKDASAAEKERLKDQFANLTPSGSSWAPFPSLPDKRIHHQPEILHGNLLTRRPRRRHQHRPVRTHLRTVAARSSPLPVPGRSAPPGCGLPRRRRDDNPFGLHVEFHVHDLPRSGDPKNLTVKIGAFHRGSLADPGHLPQEFPPNSIKSQNFESLKT